MNKTVKIFMVDCCTKLIEIEESIDLYFRHGRYSEIYSLLELCQSIAIELGNNIEEYAHSDEIISYLENYCEAVYQFSVVYQQMDIHDEHKEKEKRDEMIDKVFTYVNQLSVSHEIVFFPYKASMWDSFESIWEAFCKKENCHVYVVPIPYYEYNEKTDQIEYHYEGTMLPDYVPVTSYEQYHFEERFPDYMFIHNPYDDCNRVTSIAPRFFSKNLKKYTNTLVYVPYYLTGGTVPDSHAYLPVYKNMDYIITQSESMTECYVELGIAREKILPLGSPKVDAIRRAIEHERIPAKWKEKIRGKKVLLLNTSISGLLQNSHNIIDKTEQVLEYCASNRDIALLWRPHPLLKATIKAIRPELMSKYEILLKKVTSMDHVIVDETADISRAVAISDAYIGEDTSSLVHLFGAMGKPIFILDMQQVYKKNMKSPSVELINMLIEGDFAWFVHCKCNALCKMNLNTGETEILCRIPGENAFGERLYMGICRIDDNTLILIPQWGKEEVFYYIKENSLEKRKVCGYNSINYGTLFMDAIRLEETIWMIPTRFPSIVSYNIKRKEYSQYEDLNAYLQVKDTSFFYAYCVNKSKQIFMTCKESNKIICFDTVKKTLKSFMLLTKEARFGAISFDGTYFWVQVIDQNKIILWNPKEGIMKEINSFPDDYKEPLGSIKMICCNENIYLFPRDYTSILMINRKTYRIEKADFYRDEIGADQRISVAFNWTNNYYFAQQLSDTKLITMRAYDGKVVIYDEECEDKIITPNISNNHLLCEFMRHNDNIPYAMRETEVIHLEMFVQAMNSFDQETARKSYDEILYFGNETCGERVCEVLLHECE